MEYSQVLAAVHGMSAEEINGVVEAVKLRRTRLARSAAGVLSVGDRVEFAGRAGRTVGQVRKINRKTVVVDCGAQGQWRVTASMLARV